MHFIYSDELAKDTVLFQLGMKELKTPGNLQIGAIVKSC